MRSTVTQDPPGSSIVYDMLPEHVRKFWAERGATAETFAPGQISHPTSAEVIADIGAKPAPANRAERRAKERVERPTKAEPVRRENGAYKSGRGRREEIRRRMKANREADKRRMDRLHHTWKISGVKLPEAGRMRGIDRAVWVMCSEVIADRSGTAARLYLRRYRNKLAIGAIIQAALCPVGDGLYLRTWSDDRARKICALGLALLELSVGTKPKGRYTQIVRGITRGALCALLADPYDRERKPSKTSLSGIHRPWGTIENGQIGYLTALERAGFMYRQQVPPEIAAPWERWGDWTSNRYWIAGNVVLTRVWDGEVRASLWALHNLAMELHDTWRPKRATGAARGAWDIRQDPDPTGSDPPS